MYTFTKEVAMFRTQIYLTEAEKQSLKIIGQKMGKSQSMLIREAIDAFIHQIADLHSQEGQQRTIALQAAKGLWAKRDDLPNFTDLRKSFDRQRDNDEETD
jgi:predicted DNA-binding protein